MKPANYQRAFIREWREFRGLSQEELAFEMQTSKGYLSSIENAQQQWNQKFIEKAAKALGTTVLALISGPPSRESIDPIGEYLTLSHEDRVRALSMFKMAVSAVRAEADSTTRPGGD